MPFYVNPVSQVLRRCLANPKISECLVRYPVAASSFMYMYVKFNNFISFIDREIYHGRRWNSDKRFAAPMAIIPTGEFVFVDDIVGINYCNIGIVLGRVVKFFQKVRTS